METENLEISCNKCEFYEGVHDYPGHAPCSYHNVGGVLWNDKCSNFKPFMATTERSEVGK